MSKKELAIRLENRKIGYLRFLVDFLLAHIAQGEVELEEAQMLVEDLKRTALGLFPDKEEAFELIYRPRFQRVIRERFRLH